MLGQEGLGLVWEVPHLERQPGSRGHAAMTEGAEGMLLSNQPKSTGMRFLPPSLDWKIVVTMEDSGFNPKSPLAVTVCTTAPASHHPVPSPCPERRDLVNEGGKQTQCLLALRGRRELEGSTRRKGGVWDQSRGKERARWGF